ncbi:MAG: hypothetical protein A3K19_28355 [Lentisphaerae bacterium RIFOXYB12_FULL_65_16]|nr:MAG: hypothetical protein A3K18_19605 [Lentisphaerae bacterium RIFOXYA12_64_32]OGV85500.1 MAG: hypothetical protein A3K19_28355 [Lentisphaerae bacterium RIFOXYB12_FULL_65_16]
MNADLKRMIERQARWQRGRSTETWSDKLEKSAAARESMAAIIAARPTPAGRRAVSVTPRVPTP